MNWKQILLLVFLILSETFAAASLREAAEKRGYIAGGIIGYVIVALLFFLLLNLGTGVALTNGLWNAGSLITITLVGVMVFGENLKWNHYLGIGLAVLSSILLMFGDSEEN